MLLDCFQERGWRRGKELNPPRTDCPSTVLKTAATTRHAALSGGKVDGFGCVVNEVTWFLDLLRAGFFREGAEREFLGLF